MKGVAFGAYHSYDDLHLILESKEIGSPAVKTKKLDIDGADSALDLTDFFGEPKYEDVIHNLKFSTIVPQSEFLSLFSSVKNAIHGKKMRIIFDDDPLFFYFGRCYLSAFTNEKNIGIVAAECVCEPYKNKLFETIVTQSATGTATINLINSRKRVVPTISTTAPMTISFNGYSTTRSAGTFIIPELELIEGNNAVSVTGTGIISFSYREGEL